MSVMSGAGPARRLVPLRRLARIRQRHALLLLEDRLLRDIGVDGMAAAREAAKPFWRS
jgi:uncharacterized protein YjiS (DUF1127 family)